jgi:hypothetical protein
MSSFGGFQLSALSSQLSASGFALPLMIIRPREEHFVLSIITRFLKNKLRAEGGEWRATGCREARIEYVRLDIEYWGMREMVVAEGAVAVRKLTANRADSIMIESPLQFERQRALFVYG